MRTPPDQPHPVVMQLEGERHRHTVQGLRTDDHSRCTLVVVEEIGGTVALYPHGWDRWGVRIAITDAHSLARAILGNEP